MELINNRYKVLKSLEVDNYCSQYIALDLLNKNKKVLLYLIYDNHITRPFIEYCNNNFYEISSYRQKNIIEVYYYGIVNTIDDKYVEETMFFYTTEFVDAISLLDIKQPLDEYEILEIYKELSRALDYLHYHGIIYKYIGVESIKLIKHKDKYSVKLLDLINIRRIEGIKNYFHILTCNFIAPEYGHNMELSEQADIYSLGALLYYLLNLKQLDSNHLNIEVENYQKQKKQDLKLLKIIQKMTSLDRDQRYSTLHECNDDFKAAYKLAEPIETSKDVNKINFKTSIVGRNREIKQILDVCDIADNGTRGFNKNLVLVSGQRGLGKTRLLNEVENLITWKKYKTFFLGIKLQNQGFSKEIRSVLKQFVKISPKSLVTKYGRELVKLIPELRNGRDILPSQILGEKQEELRLYDRVANFMLEVSFIQPCVILIDDFHLVDRSIADFVNYLLNLNKVKKAPLLLILSYEDDQFYLNKAMEYIHKWSLEHTLNIKLSRLTVEETAKMIRGILGWKQNPLSFASYILRETEGIPGHIEEVIKKLYSQKLLVVTYSKKTREFCPTLTVDSYDKIVLSQNLDEVLLKQIQALDCTMRKILDVISIFNTEVSKDIIKEMLENEEDDDTDHFLNLTELKILSEKFDDWGYTYGFHNRDFKNYIYNNLDPGQKTLLHSRASRILEKLYIKDGRSNKDELIYHLKKSNQIDKAVYYCIQSGITMLDLYVYEQAYTFFNQAYDLLEDDFDSRKLTVLLHLGEISLKLSKNKEAIDHFNYALRLAKLQHQLEKFVDAKIKLALIHAARNEIDLAQEYLLQSIDKAKEIKYIRGTMEAASSLSRLYMQIREISKMKGIAEEYFDYALQCNDPYFMGVFIGQRGIVEYFQENIVHALEFFKKSVEYLEQANKIEETSRSINNIGVIYNNHFQDTYNARLYFEKALKVSQQYHKIDEIIVYTTNVAECYMLEHKDHEAINMLRKNLEVALEYEDETLILLVYVNLIKAYTNIGEYKYAHTYLLKAKSIYEGKKFINRALYSEIYLEACAELYAAIGVYNEALKKIEEFFEGFSDAEYSIQLRMKKLHYFIKYSSGQGVEDEELLSLVEDYRKTTYTRDRRIILLEGAHHFAQRRMFLQAKLLLEEDSSLVHRIDNKYFILKRKYIESLLLNHKNQKGILENLLLDKDIDFFKEMKWRIYFQLGQLYLETYNYFRSINNFLNALDTVYILFNAAPNEFKRSYLLKDHKYLIRMNLFGIKRLIENQQSPKSTYIYECDYQIERDRLILEENLEYFFDILEIQGILENKKFYELALDYYDKTNKFTITDINQLISSFTDDSVNNLNLLLQFFCRTTLASRGAIIIEREKYETVVSIGSYISEEKINSILEGVTSSNKEMFIKSSLSGTRDFSREFFRKDTRALICLPIYRAKEKKEMVARDHRRSTSSQQKKVAGYLYLETDKIFNNFSEEALNTCKSLLPLAGILLNNYYLTIFSSIDKLTGAYVRKYFEQLFAEEIKYANEINQPLSIIMLDIDHFKNVNDNFGHQRGDIVLREVGKIIKRNIRSTDYVGRYGGEEFVVLLPGADKKNAYNIAEKIRKNVEISNLLGKDLQLTVSCGVATFPQDGNNQEQILEKADQALYTAKEDGRNQSVVWQKHIALKNKRVDKLAGIVTGNIVQDQRNVLVITEIIKLISTHDAIEDKIFNILGRFIEILEADEGLLLRISNKEVHEKYFRKRFVEDWVAPFAYNENLIQDIMETKQGKYLIDWENITDIDPLTNTPNWKSVMLVPLIVNNELCGIIYLSVPIKEKEFDYNAYNLVEITSSVIGAILKTRNN